MFEQPTGNEEKDRSRTVMILSGIAVMLVVVLIILVTSFGTHTAPAETSQRGSQEFDSYAQFVRIDIVDKRHGERLNTKYGRISCKVENTGDKVLSALQLRAAAIDLGDVTVKEKIIHVVPNSAATLRPNQSVDLDIYLEPISDPANLKDMIIEVFALKVQ